MKSLILTLLLVVFSAGAQAKPLMAVLFYADWCGACQVLDPAVTEARENAALDSRDVLFVRLDLTDDASRHQAQLMADTMGIGDLVAENGGKTGFLLLLDEGRTVGRITRAMAADEIASTITAALET